MIKGLSESIMLKRRRTGAAASGATRAALRCGDPLGAIAVNELDQSVASPLRDADRALRRSATASASAASTGASIAAAKAAADRARESTFPYLEDEHAHHQLYASAYAAATLIWAECLIREVEASGSLEPASQQPATQQSASDDSGMHAAFEERAADGCEGTLGTRETAEAVLRAVDLALLRGGVEEWTASAAPLQAAKAPFLWHTCALFVCLLAQGPF